MSRDQQGAISIVTDFWQRMEKLDWVGARKLLSDSFAGTINGTKTFAFVPRPYWKLVFEPYYPKSRTHFK